MADAPDRDEAAQELEWGDGEELIIDEYDSPHENEEFLRSLVERKLLPTGCCYDDRMKLHSNADFGPVPHHPEDPRRIEEIMKIFKKAGLVFTGADSDLATILQDTPTKYMWRVPARSATKDEILTVHTGDHYDYIESFVEMDTNNLRTLSREMDTGRASLYVGALSFEAALLAAGGAIETCKNVVEGKIKNGIAVIRPPGHHAEFDQPMGFCFFNNVPVAAKVCQQEYPETCRKILILDWDVHHGNGIQNMFYSDPNILYISLHVYQEGNFYPGKPDNPYTPDGGIDSVGDGVGEGKNINIGWADQGMGDGEYLAAFQKIVMPIAQEFNPDLVIISAGFDAAKGDELGGCFVTPGCYAHMTHMLMSLAGGKVAVCLEGGYDLKAISQSALAVARTLMGEPPPQMKMPRIDKGAARVLAKVQTTHAPYWECMRPGVIDPKVVAAGGSSRLHDVIRSYQRQNLGDRFSMVPLFIQRENLFKSFENQVLVTPNISQKGKLLLVIHDPPELVGMPDLIDNAVDPHNAFVSDGVTNFIQWAHENDFGVIDANVPHYITRPEDVDPFMQRPGELTLSQQIKELMNYIWDNYVQLYDFEDLFLIGVGNANLGVKLLLTERHCKDRIAGVVNFVTGNLRPVKSATDEYLSGWYKRNSLVYVSAGHACWSDPILTKKVIKKRYGDVHQSQETGLNRMMELHAPQVFEFITDRLTKSGYSTEEDKMS
ncbi:Histone deacetylase hda1 [Pestalotiopsis sp. 9143b]|nr:Histone deacetylase hda1 [Pestalotiopsis sp. 9143b]